MQWRSRCKTNISDQGGSGRPKLEKQTRVGLSLSILFIASFSLSSCTPVRQGVYGQIPGYEAYCYTQHDSRPIRAGHVGGPYVRRWDSYLAATLSDEQKAGLSESEIGYFSRAEAREQCRLHRQDFPGHDCRIRQILGGPIDNMG